MPSKNKAKAKKKTPVIKKTAIKPKQTGKKKAAIGYKSGSTK